MIDEMNAEWIREQFAENLANEETYCRNGLKIKEKDVLEAFKIIGKDKAPSYDGMTDTIF